MAQRFRALVALADQDLIPSICTVTPVLEDLMPLLTYEDTRHVHGTQTHMHAEHPYIQNKINAWKK